MLGSYGLPAAFAERMLGLLGADAESFFAAYTRSPVRGVRANPLKIDPGGLSKLLGLDLEPVPWCRDGYLLPEGVRLGATTAYAAGLCYVQEPSAMAVVEALDVQPGHIVLDAAAAPGGKATQIASKLNADGLLVANDVDPGRVPTLAGNLDRWGSWRVAVSQETLPRLAQYLPEYFDRVLLDAPCSGEGMFRRDDKVMRQWQPGHVWGCASRQRALLGQAAALVRPGGVLVYSTCTFAPEENEQQVAGFLENYSEWKLLEIPWREGFEPGRPEWCSNGDPELAKTVRLWPHRLPGEGHFLAKLHRSEAPRRRSHAENSLPEKGLPLVGSARKRNRNDEAIHTAWHEFADSSLRDLSPITPTAVGDRLYHLPDSDLAAQPLRWFRPGLVLGRQRPGRFEPAHALALALSAAQAHHLRPVSESEAQRYLRGEELADADYPGWRLVTMDNHPLGWGRATQGRLKNYYPKGLRA